MHFLRRNQLAIRRVVFSGVTSGYGKLLIARVLFVTGFVNSV